MIVLLIIVWGYITIGLVTALYQEVQHPAKDGPRWGDAMIELWLWPMIIALLIGDMVGGAVSALRDIRQNKAAVAENARLKEELEALKDRLYELEP